MLTDVFSADGQIALARWLILLCFVLNGLFNCAPHRVDEHVQRLREFGTPLALPVFWAGLALQLLSCSLIIIGWQARLGVIGLMLLIVYRSLVTALLTLVAVAMAVAVALGAGPMLN